MKIAYPIVLGIVLAASGCKKSEESAKTETQPLASASARPAASAFGRPAVPQVPPPPDLKTPPADAEKTASGLLTKVLTAGTGKDKPKLDDTVRVHYTGWTQSDGRTFDSSVARGRPATFRVRNVIPGWTEALQLMVVGEKRRLWIPANLAYGEKPRGAAPAGPLVFDVELLDLIPAPEPPPVPEDVKAPPKTAKKTASGLAYRVLKPGTGEKPKANSTVVVNYTGWTTDGKMFDSSVMRGRPATFRLDQVIKGWTEGLQLMKVGEKDRFWIPGDLAYGDKPTRPGAPSGMLVFDIELVDIRAGGPMGMMPGGMPGAPRPMMSGAHPMMTAPHAAVPATTGSH